MNTKSIHSKKLYFHICLIVAAVIAVLGFIYEVLAIL
ncbi:hypothetical protein BDW_13075 [Bdellovibrio bacteriovorus W]|nr:hypothetical protein BDW_13075 [Bdellovibrio bacteriovorus W]